jgi:hypothetical protein
MEDRGPIFDPRSSTLDSRLLGRRPLAARQVERAPQQLDGALDIARRPQVQADPAGVRQNVVRLGQAGGHDLVAHTGWKRDIDQVVAMDMAKLARS